jgi:hypothetical protein
LGTSATSHNFQSSTAFFESKNPQSAAIMNKFTAIFIAILASEASARLRAPANRSWNHPKKDGEAYDARIIISGLLQQNMAETDLKTIGESAVTAYNDVFSIVGFAIGGLKTQASVPLDSMSWDPPVVSAFAANQDTDASVITYDGDAARTDVDNDNADYNSGGCDGPICIDDSIIRNSNAAVHSELIFVGVDWYNNPRNDHHSAVLPNVAQLHKAFERSFCTKLHKSGSANFANVRDCSFRFVVRRRVSSHVVAIAQS